MDWEESYRQGEIPWDLDAPAPPLLDLLAGRPVAIWGEGPILVPGCGRGHDAAALHAHGHEVIGLDLAPSALRAAEERYGAEPRLRWVHGDFFDRELAERHSVSAIWEHTCFCAIHPDQRPAYVEAAARWLRPDGRLICLFFLDPPDREDGQEGPPYGSDRREIRQLFGRRFRFESDGVIPRSHPSRGGREWAVELVRTG